MKVEQFVMAYHVEQDRLRAILPDGFNSLRTVCRINAEIINEKEGYIEFNTAIEKDKNRGWLNIAYWKHVSFKKNNKTVVFQTDFLEISFTKVGIEGLCPAEKDNDGCYFLDQEITLRKPKIITNSKEFCDCTVKWKFSNQDAQGKSLGKTLPAYFEEVENIYPKEKFMVENVTKIPCQEVLGCYVVQFERNNEDVKYEEIKEK